MRNPKDLVKSLVLSLFVAGAGQASATIYTIGGTVGVDLESGWNLNIDGVQDGGGNALVGGIKLIPSVGSTIYSVCTDIQGNVYLGSQYNYIGKAFQGQDGLNPNWGYGNGPGNPALTPVQEAIAAAAIQNAAYLFDLHKSVLTGGSLSDKAALQLAVWEALYDTGNSSGYSFVSANGRFEASSADTAATTTALNWLTADLGLYGQKTHTTYSGNLLQPILNNNPNTPDTSAQEMIGTLTAVPEPTTMIAGALLLLPFAASTLRMVRKHRTA